jgi:hypothetical protein
VLRRDVGPTFLCRFSLDDSRWWRACERRCGGEPVEDDHNAAAMRAVSNGGLSADRCWLAAVGSVAEPSRRKQSGSRLARLRLREAQSAESDEAAWQSVEQKPSQEFVHGQVYQPLFVFVRGVPLAKRDLAVAEGHQPTRRRRGECKRRDIGWRAPARRTGVCGRQPSHHGRVAGARTRTPSGEPGTATGRENRVGPAMFIALFQPVDSRRITQADVPSRTSWAGRTRCKSTSSRGSGEFQRLAELRENFVDAAYGTLPRTVKSYSCWTALVRRKDASGFRSSDASSQTTKVVQKNRGEYGHPLPQHRLLSEPRALFCI